MVYPSTIFIVLLLVTTTSVAHSRYLLGSTDIGSTAGIFRSTSIAFELPKVDISGQLACSASGNPEPGVNSPPLVGVDMNSSCDGGKSSLAQVQTDINGSFTLNFNALELFMLNRSLHPSRFGVLVKLPISCCSLLPINWSS
ncbi:Pollen Ole e 1 allergen and extensin family protein [Quillaja saponaria]|uniref:Pollen Ole e 1 allergen and extensin family protein n=1 Tax=Quillaja saponaria TaxID=32244 RepID=A0AAD7Q7Z9_QUISA|nr:Pollen Ole e 1 allergen and extensin family protein [Quillaja saponaria]